jgi:hypothetical protein
MPIPDQPDQTDTDRIIAANQEESAKTRRLLLWIFVGIPVVGLLVWGVVWAAGLSGGSGAAGAAPDASTAAVASGPEAPTAPVATVTEAPAMVALDARINADGIPLDLGGAAFPDGSSPESDPTPSAFVQDMCSTMGEAPQGAQQFLDDHYPSTGDGERAGLAALKIGVPVLCPQFTGAVNAYRPSTGT